MLVVMQQGASKAEIAEVESLIDGMGYTAHPIRGVEHTVIGCIGDERGKTRLQSLETQAGVAHVIPILKPYKLAGKELRKEKDLLISHLKKKYLIKTESFLLELGFLICLIRCDFTLKLIKIILVRFQDTSGYLEGFFSHSGMNLKFQKT